MFESVLARNPSSLTDFHRRLKAVHDFLEVEEATSLAAANKRIANILKDRCTGESVDPHLFCEDAERRLYERVEKLMELHRRDLDTKDYASALNRLAHLRPEVDTFFDQVMVMVDEEKLRINRLALLNKLRGLFLDVADISHISTVQ